MIDNPNISPDDPTKQLSQKGMFGMVKKTKAERKQAMELRQQRIEQRREKRRTKLHEKRYKQQGSDADADGEGDEQQDWCGGLFALFGSHKPTPKRHTTSSDNVQKRTPVHAHVNNHNNEMEQYNP
mmetsp:Transcript_69248/g.149396  ORF Transcript_69248/g.149396 Transcript_69248/m.149396 type:complete len:126 (-) Transcript_69248:445-822(-)